MRAHTSSAQEATRQEARSRAGSKESKPDLLLGLPPTGGSRPGSRVVHTTVGIGIFAALLTRQMLTVEHFLAH